MNRFALPSKLIKKKVYPVCIAVLFAGLLCGCDQQKPDPKIAELESRVAAAEKHLDDQRDSFNATLESMKKASAGMDAEIATLDLLKTNYAELSDEQYHLEKFALAMGDVQTNLEADVAGLQNSFSNLVMTINGRPTSRAIAQNILGTKSGVPAEVYNQIAADAVRDWPGNYDMQKFRIEQQVTAYKQLHGSSQ